MTSGVVLHCKEIAIHGDRMVILESVNRVNLNTMYIK